MDLYNVRKELSMGKTLNDIKLRVTYYSRVSTDHFEQKSSLRNQIDYFCEMINSNSNWIYVPGYVDDGISGTSDIKRDSFMKMIDDAKNGLFDLIVTKEISRFSRNTLDSIKYTRELLSLGVAVLFLNDNINTAFPDSELRLTIMASMAQDEIRRLSERVKFGMRRSIKNGNILGNDIFGYKKDRTSGNLVIVEEEAILVRKLFNMYVIDSYSLSKITKLFSDITKRKWYTSTLIRMISNPKYKGYYCGNKTERIDYLTKKVKVLSSSDWIIYKDNIKVPPIVDEYLWEQANLRLLSRKKGNNKNVYKNRYPLSAKIYCSLHDTVFYRRKVSKNSFDFSFSCCLYFEKGKNKCHFSGIRESEIYSIFDDFLYILDFDLSNVFNILFDLYKSNISSVYNNKLLESLIRNKEKILNKKEKLLELSTCGSLSNSEFKDRNDKCNLEIIDLERRINLFYKQDVCIFDIDFKNILKDMTNIDFLRNKLFDLLLNKIVVRDVSLDNTYICLDMFFNFSDYDISDNLSLCTKEYQFKRGYDKTCTKRYIVTYKVNFYFC